ncbi:MAG: DUF354 domain-containing protein [Bacteroidales bacterium]|nr:DUF354 domain-containing protein [Bacteroidales bacterium]
MKILFYFGHPAQYHFIKNTIRCLRERGHNIILSIKTKDVLEKLLREDNEVYNNLLPEGRKQTKLQILIGLLKRDLRLWHFVRGKEIDLFVGTDPSLAHIGHLLKIPVLTVLEDDYEVISGLAKMTFPFTNYILAPSVVRVGKFSYKKISYDGYMKLAYLHPNYFTPELVNIKKPFFLLRLSQLKAHHDFGIGGLSDSLVDRIIATLSKHGGVAISSEKPLKNHYSRYLLRILPSKIHHYLANSSLLISDSQSMTMEAAMLGIPSIRFSDFAGRISVLEELEHKYGLTFGIKTDSPEKLFLKINELLSMPDLKKEFEYRRKCMLVDKIDVTAFMVWFIENYPSSAQIMHENPDYQYNFR